MSTTNPFSRSVNIPGEQDMVATRIKAAAAIKKDELSASTPTPSEIVSDRDDVAEPIAEMSDREEVEVVESLNPEKDKKPYTRDELLPLLDMLLNNGYAIEEFKIRDISVIIRTRFGWEDQTMYKRLDKSDVKTALTYQREFSIVTLAASIAQYGNTKFEPINAGKADVLDKSFNERYEFILSLNSVVSDIIQGKLAAFDEKQRYIVNHFDELLKDF